MDPKFLKLVQDKGWLIAGADEEAVIAKCPAEGCSLKAKLSSGRTVPQVDPGARRPKSDITLVGYEDLRQHLRDRRTELGFTIREIESVIGVSEDHIAKAEKDNPSKKPGIQTIVDWCNALGYELVLRPTPLSLYALRMLSDTRGRKEARQKRAALERRRREGQ